MTHNDVGGGVGGDGCGFGGGFGGGGGGFGGPPHPAWQIFLDSPEPGGAGMQDIAVRLQVYESLEQVDLHASNDDPPPAVAWHQRFVIEMTRRLRIRFTCSALSIGRAPVCRSQWLGRICRLRLASCTPRCMLLVKQMNLRPCLPPYTCNSSSHCKCTPSVPERGRSVFLHMRISNASTGQLMQEMLTHRAFFGCIDARAVP